MSKKFLVSLDLNKNELLNARLQNLSSDPSSPVAGQIYYNTQDNVTKFYDGTQWVSGGSTKFGLFADRPAASKAGTLFVATDTYTLYLDNGTSWIKVSVSPQDLTDAITNANLTIEGTSNQIVANTVDGTATLSLSSYVSINNDADGYPVILLDSNGQRISLNNYDDDSRVLDIQTDYNDAVITAQQGLTLYSNNSNIVFNADGRTIANGNFDVNNNARISRDLNVGGWNNSDGTLRIADANNYVKVYVDTTSNESGQPGLHLYDDARLKFVDNNNEIYTANIGIDQNNPGQLSINATGELVLSTDGSQSSGNIILNPDGHVQVNGNLNASNRLFAGNGIYVGGTDYENDGFLNIQDYNGNNVFAVVADGNLDGGTATVTIKGNLDIYGPGAFGNKVGALHRDNDDNLVIDASQNNLILTSDSGNAYMNSVASDNRIITVADLAAVSSGLAWKQAVNLLVDVDVPIGADFVGASYDSHPAFDITNAGYRLLLTGQVDSTQNGIYELIADGATLLLNRSADADANDELKGAAVFVMEGNQYGATSWVQSNHYITAFANQEWHQFSGQGTYTAGNGLDINGTEFSVKIDGPTLGSSSDGLYVRWAEGGGFNQNTDGLYVYTGTGLTLNNSGQVAIDSEAGYGVRKFTTTIGNNSATSFNLDHNFDTRHVTVQVFEAASPYAQVETDVERTTTNRVTIKFASAPGVGEYEVVIVG